MNLNGLTCRVYLGLRELKIREPLRRIPVVKRSAKCLLKLLLPSKPVWVQVRSGMSQGIWMRLKLPDDARFWRGEHEPTSKMPCVQWSFREWSSMTSELTSEVSLSELRVSWVQMDK